MPQEMIVIFFTCIKVSAKKKEAEAGKNIAFRIANLLIKIIHVNFESNEHYL